MREQESLFGLEDFSGLLPLFPLPGVVLFPCTLLPLHIFEPRYRAMVREAKGNEGCIGMVLLRPGWEKSYAGNPPVHDVCCLGKLVEVTPLEDGRYDIVLCGVKRARIEAVLSDKPYRTARVELLEDTPLGSREPEALLVREKLVEIAHQIPQHLFRHKNLPRALRKLDAPLGTTADILSDSLLLPPPVKQTLLEELDPFARAETLIRVVETELRIAPAVAAATSLSRRFPPEPSIN